MIKSILLQPLRNGELIQFLTDFLAIVLKNNPDNLKVRTLYDALRQIADDTEKLFKISQGSIITRDIEAADLRRDNAITGITMVANAYTYNADAVLQGHGRALTAHLAIFGSGIARDNYLSETASIRNIIGDWNVKPDLKAGLTALGLDAWKAELEAGNNNFTQLYTARNEELASASSENLKAKRVEAYTGYYKLRDRLNSHLDINDGAEPWATTINQINQSIDNYNALLARRVSSDDPATTPAVTPVA